MIHSGEFDLHDHHKAKFELCNWSGKSIHANTTKARFGCSVEFFMKPRASYKYMDTQMLIGLAIFQIEDRPVVSCFLVEVVLLIRIVRNNQQLHYQARRQNT